MQVEVDCYSVYKADERPVRFRLEGHEYLVEELLDQWYGQSDVFFKVRADEPLHTRLRIVFASRSLASGLFSQRVATKPSFREAIKKRRCLIPADGFYEWKKDGKVKTPFCFTMADDSIFAFAGLWETWKNPEGQLVETCSIITTTPNSLLQDVHDRMPVILPDDTYDLWLDPGFQKADAVCDLLKPFDSASMRRYEVSNRVNLVKNNDAACAEPVVREAAAGV